MQLSGRYLFIVSLLVPLWTAADEAKQAEQLLQRMQQAAHTQNYTATFIYQQGKQLTAMQIFHAFNETQGERERLISQDAIGREVIRDKEKVVCILPDIHSVVIERGRPETEFPPEFPTTIEELKDTYEFFTEKPDRVAGRIAKTLYIKPRDKFRYGHRLWVDEKTGLLLKKKTYDEKNKMLEMFMFTEIRFSDRIDEQLLEPGISSKDFKLIEADTRQTEDDTITRWRVRYLPAGFYEDVYSMRQVAGSKSMIDHFVFTDGLASVSVFIESITAKNKKLIGASRRGIVNTFGRVTNEHHIMAVGEVPQATVKLINQMVYLAEDSSDPND